MRKEIANLRQGDKKTFDQIFGLYYPQVINYVQSKIANVHLVEEVAQITFIKLWEYRNHLSEELALNIQIFRIAKTVLIDQLRKQYRKKNDILFVGKNVLEHGVDEGLQNSLSYNETYQRLYLILNTLPPIRRKVFMLSRIDGFSHKEIAELLNISTKTIESHITKALKHIRPLWRIAAVLFVFL